MAGEPAASGRPSTGSGQASDSEKRLQRNLKILIGVITGLIFIGLGAIAARIAIMPDSKPPTALETPSPVPGRELLPSRINLPEASTIEHLALDGDRLAISYRAADGQSIMIVDFAQGVIIKTLKVEKSGAGTSPSR